jgi:hypothetical protein
MGEPTNRARIGDYGDGTKRILFWCPGCGTHHQCTVGGVSAVWQWNESLERPTLSPSVLVRTGHYWPAHKGDCWCDYNRNHPDAPAPFECTVCHSFVTDGRIQFLGDCTHKLAGQTVDLPEVPHAG